MRNPRFDAADIAKEKDVILEELKMEVDNPEYLIHENDDVKPKPEFITLLHGDIREASIQKQISEVDFVLSTSVFEHLDDFDFLTFTLLCLLVQLTFEIL